MVRKKEDIRELDRMPILEEKSLYWQNNPSVRKRKQWYLKNYADFKLKLKVRKTLKLLKKLRLPKHLSFFRWILIDYISGKQKRFWGIYQFVALPGEGKTLSMVAHMERARRDKGRLYVATNFNYRNEDMHINHWSDIITASLYAKKNKLCCIIALDEIHITFDSSDWHSFPPEMLALLSFNRKFSLQFLCSSQIYDRIPKKIRDIANFTVICKNIWGCDRYFRNYYFTKDNYETQFSGKRAKCEFIRDYIADDSLYSLYDTLEQVDQMKLKAQEEKSKREEAFNLLFGDTKALAERMDDLDACAQSSDAP